MTARKLKSLLLNGERRITPIEEIPKDDLDAWVQTELDRRNAEADRKMKAQMRRLQANNNTIG